MCIRDRVIISDIHPGKGVIHSQASYIATNQNNAKNQMNLGQSPQQIITWLQANDVQGNASIRQYGIVDLDSNGKPRVAAFTGANCMNYKNHITGPNYSIQGNILLGQQILDSMEARFLNEPGDLACKLMAAMQGAKVIGADTRCTNSGNSSLSSFLRVAKKNDVAPNYYISLNVPQGPVGFEPIDSLQTLFSKVHNCLTSINEQNQELLPLTVSPNPATDHFIFMLEGKEQEGFSVGVFNTLGQQVLFEMLKSGDGVSVSSLETGIYFYKAVSKDGRTASGKFAKE